MLVSAVNEDFFNTVLIFTLYIYIEQLQNDKNLAESQVIDYYIVYFTCWYSPLIC